MKDLKAELRQRGLSLTGRKSVLISRLQASDAEEEEDEVEPSEMRQDIRGARC